MCFLPSPFDSIQFWPEHVASGCPVGLGSIIYIVVMAGLRFVWLLVLPPACGCKQLAQVLSNSGSGWPQNLHASAVEERKKEPTRYCGLHVDYLWSPHQKGAAVHSYFDFC